jgi:hypothetical protein
MEIVEDMEPKRSWPAANKRNVPNWIDIGAARCSLASWGNKRDSISGGRLRASDKGSGGSDTQNIFIMQMCAIEWHGFVHLKKAQAEGFGWTLISRDTMMRGIVHSKNPHTPPPPSKKNPKNPKNPKKNPKKSKKSKKSPKKQQLSKNFWRQSTRFSYKWQRW